MSESGVERTDEQALAEVIRGVPEYIAGTAFGVPFEAQGQHLLAICRAVVAAGWSPPQPKQDQDELIERARHESSEDRRIAALMKEPKNRQALHQRADVTDDLIARVELEASKASLYAAASQADYESPGSGEWLRDRAGKLAACKP